MDCKKFGKVGVGSVIFEKIYREYFLSRVNLSLIGNLLFIISLVGNHLVFNEILTILFFMSDI